MTDLAAIRKTAFKYGIKNAHLHEGKAAVGALIGKVMALHKGVNPQEVMPLLNEIVTEINAMSADEIARAFERIENDEGFEFK